MNNRCMVRIFTSLDGSSKITCVIQQPQKDA